jgi:hypothetical protein
MITLLKYLFLNHWERKTISLVLAVIIWIFVNHSLTMTRTLENIPLRVINIPTGMTVEGLQSNGILTTKIPLTVSGNATFLEELNPAEVEIVLDANDKTSGWLANITQKNLVSLNPDFELSKAINKVFPFRFPIKLTRQITEKIPVVISHPAGEPPHDYHFLDVWPYQLALTVSGPESTIRELKTKGLNLTFNLNHISRAQLDELQMSSKTDEISYLVPDEWKRVSIPELSDQPIEIDDPQARGLKIDFVRGELYPIGKPVSLSLFYPAEQSSYINPNSHTTLEGDVLQYRYGVPIIKQPLYAKGVSRLFLEVVQDMLQISIVVSPLNERRLLDWSVQFINAKQLEERYVSIMNSDTLEHMNEPLLVKKREEYLRNRFRSYMNRFQLFKLEGLPFNLRATLKDNIVYVEDEI